MVEQQRGSALKSALVVVGSLAFAWLTVEMAFKPFLDSIRGAIAKSDPGRDPDGDGEEAGGPAASSPIETPSGEEAKGKKEDK
ncbi:unnamed protein product [Spirodela intermedia]|uniref:Uncharacterized protein n=1 Tax=Spirodela intermedia TaxID=51605 RepID=A0A7I8LFD2_SPIIN|nr:unnamed protein product [Spirodela intermedia]